MRGKVITCAGKCSRALGLEVDPSESRRPGNRYFAVRQGKRTHDVPSAQRFDDGRLSTRLSAVALQHESARLQDLAAASEVDLRPSRLRSLRSKSRRDHEGEALAAGASPKPLAAPSQTAAVV